jgi:uncharacterized protein with ParB-like and HNH nuclease domain
VEINEKNDILELEKIESEEEDRETSTANYKINTYGADFTLEILSKKIDEKEIIVPTFQRNYVWDNKKASRLIESFLLGLPVPQIFLFREPETQDLLVVDGQQRLKTINQFLKGKYEIKDIDFILKGVKKEWEGKKFSDLAINEKRKLNNCILRATIFEQIEPDNNNSSMFEIFERLNTGGVQLSQQEVRNCIYHGEIINFLNELNQYQQWRDILAKQEEDKRMLDKEMILRFLALYENYDNYKSPMKDFISTFMSKYKNISAADKSKFKNIFTKTMDILKENIGENSFRSQSISAKNIAIFDSVCVAVAKNFIDSKGAAISNFKEKYDALLVDPEYLGCIKQSTCDMKKVKTRVEKAREYLK